MKKSQLRKIIRESIKELLTEQSVPICTDPLAKFIGFARCGISQDFRFWGCATLNGVQASSSQQGELTYLNQGQLTTINSLQGAPTNPGWFEIVWISFPNNIIVSPGQIYPGGPTMNFNTIPGPCGNVPSGCNPPPPPAGTYNPTSCTGGPQNGSSLTNGTFSSAIDPTATHDPTACPGILYGCTNPSAHNYYPGACVELYPDNGTSPVYNINGTNPTCCYVMGCMDPNASNYDPTACMDDQSCISGGQYTTNCQASWLSCNQSLHPYMGGSFSDWITTWTSNNAFQNVNNNPNQPCNHICQKIQQWTNTCDSIDNSATGGGNNWYQQGPGLASYSVTVNRLRCRLDEAQNQSQIHNCTC